MRAQARNYEQALAEIRRGRKESHWMWYVFPQIGRPDDVKLRSSATLFARVSPPGSVFAQILDRYFGSDLDAKTLALLGD